MWVCCDFIKVWCVWLVRSICGLEVMFVGFIGFVSGRLLFIVIVVFVLGLEVICGIGWGLVVIGDGEWLLLFGVDFLVMS